MPSLADAPPQGALELELQEMRKLDLKKELKHLYSAPSNRVVEVNVPPINYLMIDGRGDPNTSQQYHAAVEALFSAAYGLKFAVRKSGGPDFSVMPLEGLWWTKGNQPFISGDRKDWFWTALIAQPPVVTQKLLASVLDEVNKKKNLPALARLRFEMLTEGQSVQILHLGPYSAEGPSITKLHQHVGEGGYSPSGKHHEIYLNTPGRTASEKLKTILRQPVRP
jgi:hypothetical protein